MLALLPREWEAFASGWLPMVSPASPLLPVPPPPTRMPSAATGPWGLSIFLAIYGATVSSRKWGGELEITDFVLSLSITGRGKLSEKESNARPSCGFRPPWYVGWGGT